MKKNLKNIVLSLSAILLLSACSAKNHNMHDPEIASDATAEEIQIQKEYKAHIKKIKKNKKHRAKKAKVDLKKFCFKDSRSVHYKSEERCK